MASLWGTESDLGPAGPSVSLWAQQLCLWEMFVALKLQSACLHAIRHLLCDGSHSKGSDIIYSDILYSNYDAL